MQSPNTNRKSIKQKTNQVLVCYEIKMGEIKPTSLKCKINTKEQMLRAKMICGHKNMVAINCRCKTRGPAVKLKFCHAEKILKSVVPSPI